MENILNSAISCTDPDQLQFCLKITDEEYWYCEPNWYNEKMYPGSNSPESISLLGYKGYPYQLIEDSFTNKMLKDILTNKQLWLTGTIQMNDFTEEEMHKLLDDYGYVWEDFTENADRNQIICENYFEQNPIEFRNDI